MRLGLAAAAVLLVLVGCGNDTEADSPHPSPLLQTPATQTVTPSSEPAPTGTPDSEDLTAEERDFILTLEARSGHDMIVVEEGIATITGMAFCQAMAAGVSEEQFLKDADADMVLLFDVAKETLCP